MRLFLLLPFLFVAFAGCDSNDTLEDEYCRNNPDCYCEENPENCGTLRAEPDEPAR